MERFQYQNKNIHQIIMTRKIDGSIKQGVFHSLGKGITMNNQIVCPHCGKKISNNSVIDDAANGKGSDEQFLICDCGERITYWQIDSQLREQNSFQKKLANWFAALFQKKS